MPSLALACRLSAAQAPQPLPRRVRNILAKFQGTALIPGASGVAVHSFAPGNFIESTGQTLTPVDGVVGLAVDAAGTVGPELVANGGFDSADGWTLAADGTATAPVISGGVLSFNSQSSDYTYCRRDLPSSLIAGRSYEVVVNCTAFTTGRFQVAFSGGTEQIPVSDITAAGVRRFVFVPVSSNTRIEISRNGVGPHVASFTNISVRELPGIHATQGTTQNKPVLRRGLVNLLTYSADFSNAVWTKAGSTSVGTLLSEDATTGVHGLARFTTWPAAQQATVAARVKAGTATKVWIGNGSTATACCFDISSGVVEGVIGAITGTIALDSDGFYVCTATHTAASSQTVLVGMYQTFVSGSYNSTIAFTGNTARNVTIHSAALFQGTVTAQQIIAAGGIPVTTTAPASSTLGPFFWRFDPIDDALLMTFPTGAGWNNTTIITGRATGQVTQTAQNVQGTHSITGGGDMYCRFYVPNGSNLSASELQAIQRFANRVAGVA